MKIPLSKTKNEYVFITATFMAVIFYVNLYLEDTIMSYKNNAISSDDLKAIEKLTEKLHKCEELQTLMKKANAHYKKYGTVKGCEGISDEKAENLDTIVRRIPSILSLGLICRFTLLMVPSSCSRPFAGRYLGRKHFAKNIVNSIGVSTLCN